MELKPENNAHTFSTTQVKIVIEGGAVHAVLKDQEIPIQVEIIDIDKDYADYEQLLAYRHSLYADPTFKECEFTSANFEES